MANKQLVTIHVEDYGDFEAAIRDFEMELRISARTDEQMWARQIDPNRASISTRNLFYYLAVFAETCEKTPDGFDVATILKDDPLKAQRFLLDYIDGLVKKENSFRNGSKELPQGASGSDTAAEESV